MLVDIIAGMRRRTLCGRRAGRVIVGGPGERGRGLCLSLLGLPNRGRKGWRLSPRMAGLMISVIALIATRKDPVGRLLDGKGWRDLDGPEWAMLSLLEYETFGFLFSGEGDAVLRRRLCGRTASKSRLSLGWSIWRGWGLTGRRPLCWYWTPGIGGCASQPIRSGRRFGSARES